MKYFQGLSQNVRACQSYLKFRESNSSVFIQFNFIKRSLQVSLIFSDMNEMLCSARKSPYLNVDYVKLTDIQMTGNSTEANFR